jgi:hypothetical protein
MEVSYSLNEPKDHGPSSAKSEVTRALEDWDIVSAEAALHSPRHEAWVAEHGWELVPVLAGHLTPAMEEAGPHLTACCQALLASLATRVASPKEVLVALLEQLDQFSSSLAVTRLLPALGTTLLRGRPRAMGHSWAWALATLGCHLRTVPTPPCAGLEGAERITLDLGPEGREAAHLAAATVDFLTPLVDYACQQQQDEECDSEQQKLVLVRFLVNLLGRPLSLLSQHPEAGREGEVRPASWDSLARGAALLARLAPPLGLAAGGGWAQGRRFPDEEEVVEECGVPCLLYWLLGEGEGVADLPQVHSHLHLLQLAAPHVVTLLGQVGEMRVHKGLLLLRARLAALPAASLELGQADNPLLTGLVPPLVKVILHHDTAELRTLGFTCYKLLLGAFDPEARHGFFLYLFNTVEHPGLLGWTVTRLKDTLAASLSGPALCPLYTGPSLARLCGAGLLRLEDGEKTDLLAASDALLATINLCVFLLAGDREDRTGSQALLRPAMVTWAGQLAAGLDLSVAHYRQRRDHPEDGPEAGVEVGGAALPALDREQQARVIRAALNTFDLLLFNLARLRELLGT